MRLNREVKVEKYDENKEYKCDLCILSSSWGGYPEAIKSKEYWQMIHANYKELLKTGYKYVGWDKTTRHIAVSNAVADNFYEIYKIKCDVIYNILDDIKKTKPILKLISATRLSGEKGYNRMVILANKLKQAGIKFRWIIFTDRNQYNVKDMDMEEVIYMKPTYDIFDYIKEADYGVQLSDTEGYSYFVNECLQYGTPMICTNFDSVYESVEDNINGYILDMNLRKSRHREDSK
jgi:glycosyltransferase involved in cell wall biosynthesis